jgi:hypothetical protein
MLGIGLSCVGVMISRLTKRLSMIAPGEIIETGTYIE